MLVHAFVQNVRMDIFQKKVKGSVLLVLQGLMKMSTRIAQNVKLVIIQMKAPVNVHYALKDLYLKKVRKNVLLVLQELMKVSIKYV